jgi:hypothetical protein
MKYLAVHFGREDLLDELCCGFLGSRTVVALIDAQQRKEERDHKRPE